MSMWLPEELALGSNYGFHPMAEKCKTHQKASFMGPEPSCGTSMVYGFLTCKMRIWGDQHGSMAD